MICVICVKFAKSRSIYVTTYLPGYMLLQRQNRLGPNCLLSKLNEKIEQRKLKLIFTYLFGNCINDILTGFTQNNSYIFNSIYIIVCAAQEYWVYDSKCDIKKCWFVDFENLKNLNFISIWKNTTFRQRKLLSQL